MRGRPGGLAPRPRPARGQVIAGAVLLAWIAAAAACAPRTRLTAGDGCLLIVLIACALLVNVPGYGRMAPQPPASASGAWELPAALLLPPSLALITPAVVTAIASRRIRGLGAVAAGLADGLVSAGFHALAPALHAPGTRAAQWLSGWWPPARSGGR